MRVDRGVTKGSRSVGHAGNGSRGTDPRGAAVKWSRGQIRVEPWSKVTWADPREGVLHGLAGGLTRGRAGVTVSGSRGPDPHEVYCMG
jgi:hypothetical protein